MKTLELTTRTLSPEFRIFVQMFLGKDYEISPTGVVQASGGNSSAAGSDQPSDRGEKELCAES